MPVKVNHRVIQRRSARRHCRSSLLEARSAWLSGRRRCSGHQTLLVISKYKKLADEAAYLGGWEQFFDCMKAGKKHWDAAAAAVPRAANAEKPRSFL